MLQKLNANYVMKIALNVVDQMKISVLVAMMINSYLIVFVMIVNPIMILYFKMIIAMSFVAKDTN